MVIFLNLRRKSQLIIKCLEKIFSPEFTICKKRDRIYFSYKIGSSNFLTHTTELRGLPFFVYSRSNRDSNFEEHFPPNLIFNPSAVFRDFRFLSSSVFSSFYALKIVRIRISIWTRGKAEHWNGYSLQWSVRRGFRRYNCLYFEDFRSFNFLAL